MKDQEKAEIVFTQDGDQICAMIKWKENLATDPAWFGKTNQEAQKNLVEEINNKKPYWVKIIIYTEFWDEKHELASVGLRSKTRFTTEQINAFIEKDEFIDTVRKWAKIEDQEIKTFYVFSDNEPVKKSDK